VKVTIISFYGIKSDDEQGSSVDIFHPISIKCL